MFANRPSKIQVFEHGIVNAAESSQMIAIMQQASRYHRNAIVCESFTGDTVDEDALAAIRVGALVQYAMDTHYVLSRLFWQTADEAAGAADRKLKAWQLYPRGHAATIEAARHSITFIRRAKADEKLRILAWGELCLILIN
jgi:hypothetical protein